MERFSSGCNCCQAVVTAFCKDYDVPEPIAMHMGSAFGGGMRRKEVCGAVTGALMALGMKYGPGSVDDKKAKETANAKTAEYMAEFEQRHGSYLCRDLRGKNSRGESCSELVAGAASLLEEFGV